MTPHRSPGPRVQALVAACLMGLGALHAATPQDAGKLGGPEYTPVGAERKGNASGTVPEWQPLSATPPGITGVVTGQHYPNPYASEKPIAVITSANADQHADKLTPGQLALLKRGPDEKMLVYPSHRTCAYLRLAL